MRRLIREYSEVLTYLLFGVLTTAVNYLVYLPCYNLLHLSAGVSNIIAWVIAVAFGYVVNKVFVFHTHCETVKALVREFISFVTMRLVSFGMELVLMFVTVDLLHMNDLAMKLLINILVIIANYVFSKLFIFKK